MIKAVSVQIAWKHFTASFSFVPRESAKCPWTSPHWDKNTLRTHGVCPKTPFLTHSESYNLSFLPRQGYSCNYGAVIKGIKNFFGLGGELILSSRLISKKKQNPKPWRTPWGQNCSLFLHGNIHSICICNACRVKKVHLAYHFCGSANCLVTLHSHHSNKNKNTVEAEQLNLTWVADPFTLGFPCHTCALFHIAEVDSSPRLSGVIIAQV